MNIDIVAAQSERDIEAIRELFLDYAASLVTDLNYQGFETEIQHLPGLYVRPGGELLLARHSDGTAVGCVALRPLSPTCGEMKRLFVRENARGYGVGRALVRKIIGIAEAIGYSEVKLDTLPSMERAIGLYSSQGFEPTASYYEPTPEGTRFFRLGLRSSRR